MHECSAVWIVAQTVTKQPGYVPVLIIGGILTLVAMIIVVAFIAARKRHEAIGVALTDLGLAASQRPTAEQKAQVFSALVCMHSVLRHGAKGVQWFATGTSAGRPVTVLEHAYVVSTGKSHARIAHTAVATPCPPAWPLCTVVEEHLGDKIMEFFGKKDLKLEDPTFNKRWKVRCDNEDFAVLLLSPEMQAWLATFPKGWSLRIGGGRVCVVVSATVKPEKIAAMLSLLPEFFSLVPEELSAWGNTPA